MTDLSNSDQNNPQYNIIDMIRGIHALQLYLVIPSTPFRFFIGLICKANELGFKEEISLNTDQASAIGGGDSRQVISRNRQALCKIKIDGEPILRVKVGSKQRNVAAKYYINYAKLQKYGCVWNGSTKSVIDNQSQICDSKRPDAVLIPSCSDPDPVTIHRSENIREEKEKEASDPLGDNLSIEEDAQEPNIYLTVRRKIQIKYPLMKLTDGDVGKIIAKTKEPMYEGGKIDYWFHVIDKMPEWDKLEIQNVHGILAYGKRAWPDYKKAHNIQVFFGR